MRVTELGGARRILVYGVTGSGKSTLAERLAELTGLPYHSVDDLTWRPGWVQRSEEEQRRLFTALCAEPDWILDTAYGPWRDVPLRHAPLVVALDYPRWVSLSRLLRRTVGRMLSGRTCCNGNHETLRQVFDPEESIVAWHFRSFRRKRDRIRAWADDPDSPRVILLRSPWATRRWLAAVPDAAGVVL